MNNLNPTLAPRDLDWMRSFFNPAAPAGAAEASRLWNPAAEVIEQDEGYLVSLELPGVSSDHVEITVEGKTLSIKGEKKALESDSAMRRHIAERGFGRFERSFTFPVPIDPDAVEARSKDGVLGVLVKKSPEVQPRRITIATD